jgi:hypothetical protein
MHVLNHPSSRHAVTVSVHRSVEDEEIGAADGIEKVGLRFGLARVWFLGDVLMVLAGVVSTISAAAQTITFAAPFASFTQGVVAADQGIVADANSNLYSSSAGEWRRLFSTSA